MLLARTPLRHSNISCSGRLITILHSSLFVSNNQRFAICREADRSTAKESSTSSKAGDPESYITAIIAEDLTVAYPNSQIVRIYYNGDIPEAKYGTCSDPGTFDLKPRMWNVIEESGDVPLVVSPPLVPLRVQKPLTLMTNTTGGVTTTRVATMTHTYAAPQTAVEPYVNATAQPHPTIKPNFTAQIPGKPTSNNNRTWAQVVTKGGAGPHNHR